MSSVRILSVAPLLLLEKGLAVMPLLENGAFSSPSWSCCADALIVAGHETLSFLPLLPFARAPDPKGIVLSFGRSRLSSKQ